MNANQLLDTLWCNCLLAADQFLQLNRVYSISELWRGKKWLVFVHTWALFAVFCNSLRCQKFSFHTQQSPFLFFLINTPLQSFSAEGHTWWIKGERLSGRKREELTAWVPLAWCNSLCVGRSSLPQWKHHWVITGQKPEESRNDKMR